MNYRLASLGEVGVAGGVDVHEELAGPQRRKVIGDIAAAESVLRADAIGARRDIGEFVIRAFYCRVLEIGREQVYGEASEAVMAEAAE